MKRDSINISLQRTCNRNPACDGCYLLNRTTGRYITPASYYSETREVLTWIFEILDGIKGKVPELNCMINYLDDQVYEICREIIRNKKDGYEFNLTFHCDMVSRIKNYDCRPYLTVQNLVDGWDTIYCSVDMNPFCDYNPAYISQRSSRSMNIESFLLLLNTLSVKEVWVHIKVEDQLHNVPRCWSSGNNVSSSIWKKEVDGKIKPVNLTKYLTALSAMHKCEIACEVDSCFALPANNEPCPAFRQIDLEGKLVRSCPYTLDAVTRLEDKEHLRKIIAGEVELKVPDCELRELAP